MTTTDQRQWTAHWLKSLMRRDEDTRPSVYTRRRRAWLWRPLMWAGLGLLTWQITADQPVYLLVGVGLLMCLPWVADV